MTDDIREYARVATVVEAPVRTYFTLGAVPGATVLEVVDASSFTPGSAVLVGEEVKTVKDHEPDPDDDNPDTITLTTPLANITAIDDPVTLFNEAKQAEVTRKVAMLRVEGDVDTGDLIEVPLSHALRDRLAEGMGSNELVEITYNPRTGWRLVDVDDEPPTPELPVWLGRYRINNTTLTDSTWTALNFGTISNDPDRRITYSMATNSITIDVAGVYAIVARVGFATSGIGERRIRLLVNGTPVATQDRDDDATDPIVQLHTMEPLNIGDVLTVQARQTSGGDLDVLGGPHITNIRITLLGGS